MINLTDDERREIIDEMLERSLNGVLPRRLHAELAVKWDRDRGTMSKMWRSYCKARADGYTKDAWKSKIKINSGQRKFDRAKVQAKLRAVSVEDRQVIRHAADSTGLTRCMVETMMREGELKRRSSRIRPTHTAHARTR